MSSLEPACTPDAHGHCSLCGDEAIRGVVVALHAPDGVASVRTQTGTISVAIDLLADPVRRGDVLLVHQGFAIAKVDE